MRMSGMGAYKMESGKSVGHCEMGQKQKLERGRRREIGNCWRIDDASFLRQGGCTRTVAQVCTCGKKSELTEDLTSMLNLVEV